MEEVRILVDGINRDTYDLNRSEGAYEFALNAVSSKDSGDMLAVQNEMGNLKSFSFGDFQVIFHKYIPEYEKTIVFLTDEITSKIGFFQGKGVIEQDYIVNEYCEGCLQETSYSLVPKAQGEFQELIRSTCLGFSKAYPITAFEYKTTNCSFNIYWANEHDPNRFIYFDTEGEQIRLQNRFKVGYRNDCEGEVFTDELNCEAIGWYQNYDSPEIKLSIENGGRIKEGVYQVLFQWATSKGIAQSSTKALTNPIPVFTDRVKEGGITNQSTSKGLRIQIDLDTTVLYEFYNLIIVETVDNVTSYKQVTLPKDNKEYFYTDATPLVPVTINEVYQKYPYYKNSKYLTQANGYLIQAGLREYEPYNLQRMANKIALKWVTVQLKEGDYAEPTVAQNFRGYLRDEVYSFGISFELDYGAETPVFHIPGRVAKTSEKALITDILSEGNAANNQVEYWRRYNTASVTNSLHTPYSSQNKLNPGVWEEGEFAYWESSERYANNRELWGDLCGQPQRFHKFPDNSISHHHSGKDEPIPLDYITPYETPITYIYPLGVKVESNIETLLNQAVAEGLITQEQRNHITGYKLVRGNRFGNKSIVAKGYLYNTREYVKRGVTYRFPNYPFNDLRNDFFIARKRFKDLLPGETVKDLPVQDDQQPYYTFHSPDTHFVNPSLGNILKLEVETYGTSKGAFVEAQGEAKHIILSQEHYNFAFLIAAVMARVYQPNAEHLSGSSQSIGQGIGSTVGAIAGSVLPGIGTAIGATVGGMLGGLIGSVASQSSDRLKAGPRAIMWLAQTEKMVQLITLLTPAWQYHYQYQATGKYFAYKTKPNDSNKLYRIPNWNYLQPEITSTTVQSGSLLINNWERESSVFLETDRPVVNPSVEDFSRNSRTQLFGGTGENVKYIISSHYVSIKNEIRNQYGTVFDIKYLNTASKTHALSDQPLVFGGDTFIGAFSIKRKHRFFTASTYGMGDNSDIFYEDLGNAGFPNYFFNTKNTEAPTLDLLQGLLFLPNAGSTIQSLESTMLVASSIMGMTGDRDTIPKLAYVISFGLVSLFRKKENVGDKLVGEFMEDVSEFFQAQLLSPDKYFRVPNYNFDAIEKSLQGNGLVTESIKGRIYLYSIGVPTYICESDVNLDLRHAENNHEKDFYPNQANLDFWLQEKNVSFKEDNYFFYNTTYSKQSSEHSFVINDINFKPYDTCRIYHENRAIYSQQDSEVEDNQLRDNWLINKALDYYDFSLSNGKLTGINQIENDKVLVRFENGSRMFAAYNQIQTDQDTVQIGNGGLFRSKPITFANSDLGYFGSQHRAFLSTEFGHVSVDAKRGDVFLIGSNAEGTESLSIKGLQGWFREHLPFKISEYFPAVNVDNHYNGVGLHLGYDHRLKRLLVTKLDYKPNVKGIVYYEGKFSYNGKEVALDDPLFFSNLSWTISYDFQLKKWRSWHSYTPNFYISTVKELYSSQNNELWLHNASNKFYQNFYGKQFPFVIDGFAKPNVVKTILKSVTFASESRQYTDQFDYRTVDTTFNQAIVYNYDQVSGVLNLVQENPSDLYNRIKYPIVNGDSVDVILDKGEQEYSFSQFDDKRINNLSIWNQDKIQINKKLNEESVGYYKNPLSCDLMKAQMHFVRLINDDNFTHNIIVKYIKLAYGGGVRTR